MSNVVTMDGISVEQAPLVADEEITGMLDCAYEINKTGRVVGIAMLLLTTEGYKPMWAASHLHPLNHLAVLGGVHRLIDIINKDMDEHEDRTSINCEPEEPA